MEAAERIERELYTYADFKEWPEQPRYELIDGERILMEAPGSAHQDIVDTFIQRLRNHLAGKACRAYSAPIGVRFEESDSTKHAVQPDISVVCDRKQIRPEGIVGAPALIIEALSPGTMILDFNRKKELYERYGVKEYWLVSPTDRVIYQMKLIQEERKYDEGACVAKGRIESAAVEGFGVDVEEFFAEALI